MFFLAKVLQAIGFVYVGYALYLGIAEDDMWQELYMSLGGVGVFLVGRMLEPKG
jgi:hypothetical protein